jgi:hypothetical protein
MHTQTHTPGFIPAEKYMREQKLAVTLADALVWHAEHESKRTVRAIVDMLAAEMSARDSVNPLLRKRQTMEAIP